MAKNRKIPIGSTMESKPATDRPHAVVIPVPMQSHIKAMLKLAKLLHYKGFHITFVNTEFNHKRFLKSRGPRSLDGLRTFHFEAIPDGIPPSDIDANQDIPLVTKSITENLLAPFQDLLAKLNNTTCSSVPPITCIVSDGFTAFTLKAAEEIGVPVVMSFSMSAGGVMGYKQLHALTEKGFIPLKDEGDINTSLDWIPGMKDIRLKDTPFTRNIDDQSDISFYFPMEAAERAVNAAAILVHTFDALERDALDGLSSIFRRVYAIGPLHLLLNQIQEDSSLQSIGYNLWKEESECLQWLNTKEPNSVVYVNFGSLVVLTADQLVEFAMGLASSKQQFLWTVRPDLVVGDAAILPQEFAAYTQEHGFITSWCPQEEVLNHPSVGGFLTHSGWNSTIESLAAGVPMVCLPFFADQFMNCRYSCKEWGIAMEMDDNIKREEVEKLVRELMQGEKGKKIREKAMEWKILAQEATSINGSSFISFEKMVSEVLLSKK